MEEFGEFQDWEMLQNTDTGVVNSPEICREFGAIEGDYESMIRLDYFSIDSYERYARGITVDEQSSVDSDNPSWVDPCLDSGYRHAPLSEEGLEGIMSTRKNSGEFWSDSSSDGSISRKFIDFGGKHELGIGDDLKADVGFEGIGEIEGIESKGKDLGEFLSDSGSERSVSQKFNDFREIQEFDCGDNLNKELGFQGVGEIQGIEVQNNESLSFAEKPEGIEGEGQSDGSNFSSEMEVSKGLESGGSVGAEDEGGGSCEELKLGEEGKRGMVWWKLPFELLKFCVFRVSPVWTISIAAAVMGFAILRRRLYKVKRKSRSIPLKLAVEDKKVYQFMIRATRLNEAFSVVRRVPIIRPSLPAAGVTPWPVLS